MSPPTSLSSEPEEVEVLRERLREAEEIIHAIRLGEVDAVVSRGPRGDQLDRAREILIRRARPLDDDADRQRALEYLARRGYDYETAYEAVRTASLRAA